MWPLGSWDILRMVKLPSFSVTVFFSLITLGRPAPHSSIYSIFQSCPTQNSVGMDFQLWISLCVAPTKKKHQGLQDRCLRGGVEVKEDWLISDI